uniref:Protein farnesyltransferase subunit beta n=1 Tax=Globodera pallida TaxID=36090 RepID=A0A183C343_GLOPA
MLESDGFITPTVLEQRRVEEIVVKQKREWTQTHGVHLQHKSHVDYILACLEGLPKSYSAGVGFATGAFTVHFYESCFLNFLLQLFDCSATNLGRLCKTGDPTGKVTEDGGYGGGPGQIAHLATTYASVMSLITIGTDEALSSINRKTLNCFIHSMRQPNGSFTIHKGGESDVRAVYCALSVANICGLPIHDQLFEETASWLTRCQTYEGGFGGEPNCEAHSGYTFCGLAGLALLRKLHLVNIDAALKWLVNRQMTFEGGFQGRANKLVDGCYSYWNAACFSALECFDPGQTKPFRKLFDTMALQSYVLEACQAPSGETQTSTTLATLSRDFPLLSFIPQQRTMNLCTQSTTFTSMLMPGRCDISNHNKSQKFCDWKTDKTKDRIKSLEESGGGLGSGGGAGRVGYTMSR